MCDVKGQSSRRLLIIVWVLAISLTVLLCGANLLFGDLNQDEGWYLHSGLLAAGGEVPYRDFYFTQGPLIPYTYALLSPIWAPFGIVGGRAVTSSMGLLSAAMGAIIAFRLGGKAVKGYAALTAFMLVGINAYHSYFTTIVKAYSLCAVFFTGGLLALTYVRSKGGRIAALASGALLSCAVGTRFSMAAAIPVIAVYLLWRRRDFPRTSCWAFFVAGAALAGAVVFLPPLLLCRDQFIFGASLHVNREVGGLTTVLLYKLGAVSRLVQAYYLALVLGLSAGLALLVGRHSGGDRGNDPENGLSWALGAGVLAVAVVQLSAAFPYDDYQVPLFPVAAALAANLVWCVWARAVVESKRPCAPPSLRYAGAILWIVFLCTSASACSSPVNQEWFIRGRDRIWWLKKDTSQIAGLREVAAALRARAPYRRALLLTQDTYLAVEADMRVPVGMAMGPFSYFPDMSTEDARRYRVLNRELMEDLLQTTDAPMAAFSGYGLGIEMPGVERMRADDGDAFRRIVRDRYNLADTVEHFGQGHTTLTLWRLKENR